MNIDKETLLNPTKSYLIIKFGYESEIVVSYLQGIEILKNMENAEYIDSTDYEAQRIVSKKPSGRDIEFTLLSQSEYLKMKTRSLVGA